MSAIAGMIYFDGKSVDLVQIEEMLTRLSHRGNGGNGIWIGENIALGHRMLYSTTQSLYEKFPVADANSKLVLTSDARLDNRDELIKLLNIECTIKESILDSQLILNAYEKWGVRCVEKFIGDFSFAIWDERRKRFFCARDPMGVRPFFYHWSRNGFVFASEVKAILTLSWVPKQINDWCIAYQLLRVRQEPDITFYKDIQHLPPACSMIVTGEKIWIEKYWTPENAPDINLSTDDEYAECMREVFTNALQSQLNSINPVGTLLSGGLDSSSIACTAREILRKQNRQKLHTFSAIFPSLPEGYLRPIDERKWIKSVVDSGGFIPHYVHADMIGPLFEYDKVLWHMDEPIFAYNLYLHWSIYKAAKQSNVGVILEGVDGDSVVSHGYELIADLFWSLRWQKMIKEALALSRASNGSKRLMLKIIYDQAIEAFLPKLLISKIEKLRGSVVEDSMSILNPNFAARMQIKKHIKSVEVPHSIALSGRKRHKQGIATPYIRFAIELVDKIGGAFQIEPRFPFLDRRVIEFCVGIPSEQKLQKGWNRMVMRRAMTGIIPVDIQRRLTKTDMGMNFYHKLMRYEREKMINLLFDDVSAIEEYVNIKTIKEAYHRYSSNPIQNNQAAFLLFSVAILNLWMRKNAAYYT